MSTIPSRFSSLPVSSVPAGASAGRAMDGEAGPQPGGASGPVRGAGAGGWPAGPLDAAQQAFDVLICPPAPLMFDGRGLDGVPQQLVALDELQRLLVASATSRGVRDQVWSRLVSRARGEGPAWVVAAVGMALPALRFRAGLLTRGWRGDVADLDSELLLGFLERLASIDLDTPNIGARLVEAGARAVKRARARSGPDETGTTTIGALQVVPARLVDHPDLVLARAIARAVIGPEEGFLIAQTRLDDVPLHEVAHHLGISLATAASWRRRGELTLREAIGAGDLQ